MSFFLKFKKHLLKQKKILPGDRLLVGLSGGLDSTVLLHLLFSLKEELGLFLLGVHVNYHLRGKSSQKDEDFLRQMLSKMKLPLEVLSNPILSKSSIQDQARQVRYKYFEKIAKKYRCQKIILAHHVEDQVETFLMRLIRGAGLQGLASMEQERLLAADSKLKVLRPLLSFSKEDLKSYAKEQKIQWREDLSNQKTDYLRNFLRLKFLKSLKKKNPQVTQKIFETIELIQDENDWIKQYAQKLLQGNLHESAMRWELSLSWLKKQEKPIRKRIYMAIFKEKIPTLTPTQKYLNSLDEMVMENKTQMKISFSKGYGACIQKDRLVLLRWRQQKLQKRGFFS